MKTKRKLLTGLGSLVAASTPIFVVVSCAKMNGKDKEKQTSDITDQKPKEETKDVEQTPKANQEKEPNILSFVLDKNNLGMYDFADSLEDGPDKYPYTNVAQNSILANSNSTFDYTKKTWRDILVETTGAKIENGEIKDIFGLGKLINKSSHNMVSGMNMQSDWEFSKQGWDSFMSTVEMMNFTQAPDGFKLNIDTYFKVQWPNAVKEDWTKEDYYNQLKDHLNDEPVSGGVFVAAPVDPYLPNKHIHLYNSVDNKEIDLGAEAPEGILKVVVKIED